MKNYLLTIQYDGSNYHGWQKQENTQNTIQENLEVILSRYLNESIELNGSGRTDRGVHAKGQTANFKCKAMIEDDALFLTRLNLELPSDIKVNSITEVKMQFHSRLSAVSKIYSYHIYVGDRPDVFRRKYVYHYPQKLDMNLVSEACNRLIGTHDFRGFSSEKNMEKPCERHLYDIRITKHEEEMILSFHGNGFLYNMVRILAGTILAIGTGELSIDTINKTFTTGNREFAGHMLPSNGLFLENVYY